MTIMRLLNHFWQRTIQRRNKLIGAIDEKLRTDALDRERMLNKKIKIIQITFQIQLDH